MCQRTTCKTCGKPSWKGCGAHVEQVLGDVAPADRCTCAETKAPPNGPSRKGMLARLFGG